MKTNEEFWDEVNDAKSWLDRCYQFYDLIYKDGDGSWKRVNADIHLGHQVTRYDEIQEFYSKYLRGREDWTLRIASFMYELDMTICEQ